MGQQRWVNNPVIRGSAQVASGTGHTFNIPLNELFIGGVQVTASAAGDPIP